MNAKEARETIHIQKNMLNHHQRMENQTSGEEYNYIRAHAYLEALDGVEVKALVEALMAARLALSDVGHTDNYPGMPIKCPNCDLCEIDKALETFARQREIE